MNDAFNALIACCPQPPEWRVDWDMIEAGALSAFARRMHSTEQDSQWHGEGDVLKHTRLVTEALAQHDDFRRMDERCRKELFLASLLHDIAKPACTRVENGRIIAPGHASTGSRMTRSFLWRTCDLAGTPENQCLRETVCLLVRYHAQPVHLITQEDPQRRLLKIASNGELCPDFNWRMLCVLAECDALGKVCNDQQELLDDIALCRQLAEENDCLNTAGYYTSDFTRHAYLSGRNVWPQAQLYDDTWSEVVLLSGLPGTGKDTWIRKHCSDLPVISLDDARAELDIDVKGSQGTVIQLCKECAREYLRRKQPFVWNATNLTPLVRSGLIELFENYHAKVHVVFLETAWETELKRNSERTAYVPENVIMRLMDKMVLPERFEACKVSWLCV